MASAQDSADGPSAASDDRHFSQECDDKLKELLVEQAAQNEQLMRELAARDYERSTLLQLLHRKDEQLCWQEEAVTRQRAVLQVTRDNGRYYRVLCVLRAWRDLVQRGRAWRLLERTKDQLTVAKLRHSCSMLCTTLQQAVSRQLKGATDVLWLHSSSRELWSLDEDFSKRQLKGTSDLLGSESLDADLFNAASPQPSTLIHSSPKEMLDDQTLYMTPRRTSPQVRQPHWEPSPQIKGQRLGNPSPFSEASTYAPSSCSRANAAASCIRNPMAATRLAWTLQKLQSRRLFWAMQRCRSCPSGSPGSAQAAATASAAASAAESAACLAAEEAAEAAERLRLLERSEEQEHQKSNEQLEALRTLCEGLEHNVQELAGNESLLSTQLHEVHARLEMLDGRGSFLEEQLQHQECEEQAVAHREGCVSSALEAGLWQVQERLSKVELDCEEQEKSRVERQERLQQTQTASARLEAQVAQQAAWRREAEQQITEMVSRGQVLEKERVRLLRRIADAQKAHLACKQQHDTLQSAFGREEHAGEMLHARSKALEEDNTELTYLLQQERQRHQQVMALRERELQTLRSSLQAAEEERRVATLHAQRQAEKAACEDLRRAWERDRERAAQDREGLCRQLNTAEQELGAARCAEEAAAQAAAAAREGCKGRRSGPASAALSPRWQQCGLSEDNAECRASRQHVASEAALCEQLSATLEERLARVEALQARMEVRSCLQERSAADDSSRSQDAHSLPAIKSSAAAVESAWLLVSQHFEGGHSASASRAGVSTSPAATSQSGASSGVHQTDELDGYALLVERLRSELKAERAERDSSAQALASLRGSYRQLLTTVAAAPATSPAVTPRHGGNGCAAGVQDLGSAACPAKAHGIGVVS